MSNTAGSAAEIIRSLLGIAKVAMPEHLFATDPRVLRAQALLEGIGDGSTPPLPVDEEQVPFFVADPTDPTTAYVIDASATFRGHVGTSPKGWTPSWKTPRPLPLARKRSS